MKKIRDFSKHSPIWFSVAFTLLVILVNETFANIFHLFPASLIKDYVHELLFIAWPVAMVMLFGFGFIFRQKGFRETRAVARPMILLYFITMLGQIANMVLNPDTQWKSSLEIVLGVIMLLGVGFREEILFRGVIANAIGRKYANSTKGIWITVISSGVIFGALHMANMFHGVSFQSALIQSIDAIGGGMYCCAVYLRGGSIWVVALMHTLLDAAGGVTFLFANAGNLIDAINGTSMDVLYLLPLDLLLTAFLLRKSKRQRIMDRMQQLSQEHAV